MLDYPRIDPVAIEIGPVAIHWYGLMYLIGFAAAWLLLRRRIDRGAPGWRREQLDDLLFWGAVGVLAGGRIGYVLFYGFGELLADPLSIFYVWEGGMSFHGGLLGVTAAMGWIAWRQGRHLADVTDFIAPVTPIGLGAGRLGNFINGELWGRPTDLPWAMVFPGGGPEPRHPSQLYEFLLEGVVLFALLWWFSARPRPRWAVTGVFLLGYGVFRFAVEFARAPDPHLGAVAFGWMTMGQVLCVPMILGGILLLLIARQHTTTETR
ncbi:MAG: prolipoprotein diacylglyceryl transferase [Halofilum sp. (in: g-proteobacteria)]